MKIFFLGVRDSSMYPVYKKVIKELKKSAHSVDSEWMTATKEEDAEHFENSYKRNMQSIKNCDFVVAETSLISSGLGFQIATALNQKKPVIALYNPKKQNPSATLKGSSDRNKYLFYAEYNSDEDIQKLLDTTIAKVKSSLDTKFILIIPSEIDRYLEWASDYKRMHKAQLVRQAIEDYMQRDTDWKEFLSEE
ncbi:hypothetical protein JW978_01430 [Candidatus Dojkabacteria bacterium]|nr:hypothetical protein [Candidatus Dojkabacteria bacterium]